MPRYLWQQAEGQRHAYNTATTPEPTPDRPFQTFCGRTVTPRRTDFRELGGLCFDPTCQHCETEVLNRIESGRW